MEDQKFAILAILDGWGIAPPGPGNALTSANTPNMKSFWINYPHTQLGASGTSVGLPRNEVGNTETGHLNIGAGRIVYQDLARINMSIADGSYFENPVVKSAIEHAKKNNSKIHLMGLLGAGGVHSNAEHLYALLHIMHKENFQNVFVHAFTDGRDSPPDAAATYIAALREAMNKEGIGQIASIMGRYWAMDRDQRWDRTIRAYRALTMGEGHLVKTPEEAITDSYAKGQTDEFVEPSLVSSSDGKPIGLISDNDAIIFFNFRIDRPRQLARAFLLTGEQMTANWGFDPFTIKYEKKHDVEKKTVAPPTDRGRVLTNIFFATMTEYEKPLVAAGAHVIFPPEKIVMPLGRVISSHGYRQLRASESEKERFVTFYMNGQEEGAYSGEDRLIVPSPKVATYDLKPEMSARELTTEVLAKISPGGYKLVIINFANADMVGHTGNYQAAVKAAETIDECIGKLSNFALAHSGALFITADHGNAEEMIDHQTGAVSTEHTADPVPFICIANEYVGKPMTLRAGILADIAPTILGYLGLEAPGSMMGRNLLSEVQ